MARNRTRACRIRTGRVYRICHSNKAETEIGFIVWQSCVRAGLLVRDESDTHLAHVITGLICFTDLLSGELKFIRRTPPPVGPSLISALEICRRQAIFFPPFITSTEARLRQIEGRPRYDSTDYPADSIW